MHDLATLTEQSETKFILALFVDLRGKPCAKLVPVEAVGRHPIPRLHRRRDQWQLRRMLRRHTGLEPGDLAH